MLVSQDRSLHHSRDGRASGIELLPDAGATPEELVGRREERARVRKEVATGLETLDERERRIVQQRLMSDEPATLEQLGVEMGVSRERVRQLEKRAKSKLREVLQPCVV